jgi:hypothetical protein
LLHSNPELAKKKVEVQEELTAGACCERAQQAAQNDGVPTLN